MIDTDTVSGAFTEWMQTYGYATFSADLFLNQIPDDATDNAYWVVTSGGEVTRKLVTAQSVQHFRVVVNCRNTAGRTLEQKLFSLSQAINNRREFTMDGFEVYSIEASMPQDDDRDAENRRQGSVTVDIEIYQSYDS